MNSQQAINLLNGLEQRLDDYCELNNEGKAAFRMAITALELFGNAEQLPSAQPEQRWIPCSERLPDHPKNDDYYLVTIQCEHYDGWDDYVTGFAEWTKHGWEELSCYIGQIKVVAWMPLPEPYREERTEE